MGQVYFLCHRSACPGPRAKGQGRGQGPQEVLLCLCRKCAEKPCPFCGEGIVAQDLHPATVTHLTTLQTTCSSTGDMREELDADVDCNWWKEPRYPVLPHGGIWLQDGLQTLEFACTTCGAAFEALGHMEDGRLSVPRSRGGFLFDQNDPDLADLGKLPPRKCSQCGGWLQLGGVDIRDEIKDDFRAIRETVEQQRQKGKRVDLEPGFYLLRVCSKLKDSFSVEQLLEFPELFQILNMILPTFPYLEWAKAHNCDLISASDAFLAVSRLLCAIAAFLLHDISAYKVETIPERAAVLLNSVFGKLVVATNYLEDHLSGALEFHEISAPALNVFKAMGYSMYTWDA